MFRISIHAPSRERLLERPRPDIVAHISIHAPSRERLGGLQKMLILMLFQSTLPHGSDKSLFSILSWRKHFNPRSLTGATASCRSLSFFGYSFQSTLPHGSDSLRQISICALLVFQSTLPHGSDAEFGIDNVSVAVFQSTLPHGSDYPWTAFFLAFN